MSVAAAYHRVSLVALIVLVLVAATILGGCRKSPRMTSSVVWLTKIEAGQAAAKAQNKPALFFFDASWDSAGVELEHKTFVDPEVNAVLARELITVKIDCTDDETPGFQRVRDQFSIVGLPTLVILSPDGRELARRYEFMTPAAFLQFVKSAKAQQQTSGPPKPR